MRIEQLPQVGRQGHSRTKHCVPVNETSSPHSQAPRTCACAHQRIQHRYFGGACEVDGCRCPRFSRPVNDGETRRSDANEQAHGKGMGTGL